MTGERTHVAHREQQGHRDQQPVRAAWAAHARAAYRGRRQAVKAPYGAGGPPSF
jgi:hypothetical protein